MDTPCYVIASNGFREQVSYQDDWCYGRSEHLGSAVEWEDVREMIKAEIRRHWPERNGIPIYLVSDHGNVSRGRAIRLRRR